MRNDDEIIEIAGERITLGELEKYVIKVRADYKILQRYSVPVTFTRSVDVIDGVLQHIHDLRSKVSELETEREADAVVESLNTETAKLQAELDAANAEIARLREGYVLLETIDALFDAKEHYLDSGNHDEYAKLYVIKEEMRDWDEYKARFPHMSTTDVTLNDDTQKLPVLVKCVLCEGAGFIERRQNFRDLLEVTKTCPDCHGTGKVEQLPFDGSPEHTPKFKVGDKVICTDFYGKETIMWITSIDDSPTVMNGVVIPEQGVTMRLENEHESTILHESFLRHAD